MGADGIGSTDPSQAGGSRYHFATPIAFPASSGDGWEVTFRWAQDADGLPDVYGAKMDFIDLWGNEVEIWGQVDQSTWAEETITLSETIAFTSGGWTQSTSSSASDVNANGEMWNDTTNSVLYIYGHNGADDAGKYFGSMRSGDTIEFRDTTVQSLPSGTLTVSSVSNTGSVYSISYSATTGTISNILIQFLTLRRGNTPTTLFLQYRMRSGSENYTGIAPPLGLPGFEVSAVGGAVGFGLGTETDQWERMKDWEGDYIGDGAGNQLGIPE